ncbi:MAG: hypothetical protein ABSC55_01385 [Syntrophorhabdales bacterium]
MVTHVAGAENSGKSGPYVRYILRPREVLFWDSNVAQDREVLRQKFAELEKNDLMKRSDARFQYRLIIPLPNHLTPQDITKIMGALLTKSGIAGTSWVYAVHQGKNGERDELNLHAHLALNPRRQNDGKVEMVFQEKSWLKDFKVLLENELAPFVKIVSAKPAEGGIHLGWKAHAMSLALEANANLTDLAVTDSERKAAIKLQDRRRRRKKQTGQTATLIDISEIEKARLARMRTWQEKQRAWEKLHYRPYVTTVVPQALQSSRAHNDKDRITELGGSARTTALATALGIPLEAPNSDAVGMIKDIMSGIAKLAADAPPKAPAYFLHRVAKDVEDLSIDQTRTVRPAADPHALAEWEHHEDLVPSLTWGTQAGKEIP